MKKCLYCREPIEGKAYVHKIGYFCSEAHFEAYYKSLPKEELAYLMHSICPCSHEDDGSD